MEMIYIVLILVVVLSITIFLYFLRNQRIKKLTSRQDKEINELINETDIESQKRLLSVMSDKICTQILAGYFKDAEVSYKKLLCIFTNVSEKDKDIQKKLIAIKFVIAQQYKDTKKVESAEVLFTELIEQLSNIELDYTDDIYCAIDIYSMFVCSQLLMADIYHIQNNTEKALKTYDEVIEQYKFDNKIMIREAISEAYVSRYNILVEENKQQKGVESLHELQSLFNNDQSISVHENILLSYLAIVSFHIEKNEIDKSIEIFKEIIDTYKDCYTDKIIYNIEVAYQLLASIYDEREDVLEAITTREALLHYTLRNQRQDTFAREYEKNLTVINNYRISLREKINEYENTFKNSNSGIEKENLLKKIIQTSFNLAEQQSIHYPLFAKETYESIIEKTSNTQDEELIVYAIQSNIGIVQSSTDEVHILDNVINEYKDSDSLLIKKQVLVAYTTKLDVLIKQECNIDDIANVYDEISHYIQQNSETFALQDTVDLLITKRKWYKNIGDNGSAFKVNDNLISLIKEEDNEENIAILLRATVLKIIHLFDNDKIDDALLLTETVYSKYNTLSKELGKFSISVILCIRIEHYIKAEDDEKAYELQKEFLQIYKHNWNYLIEDIKVKVFANTITTLHNLDMHREAEELKNQFFLHYEGCSGKEIQAVKDLLASR